MNNIVEERANKSVTLTYNYYYYDNARGGVFQIAEQNNIEVQTKR